MAPPGTRLGDRTGTAPFSLLSVVITSRTRAVRHVPDGDAAGGSRGVHSADGARARLARLRHDAAEAYAAITDADADLYAIAERRVAAEAAVRQAAARHQAAARAADARRRARPGLVTQLATRLRAGREWREQQGPLAAAVADAEGPLAAALQALSQTKDEFAARLDARAESVAELRRLTAECAAAWDEIDRDAERRDSPFPAEPWP